MRQFEEKTETPFQTEPGPQKESTPLSVERSRVSRGLMDQITPVPKEPILDLARKVFDPMIDAGALELSNFFGMRQGGLALTLKYRDAEIVVTFWKKQPSDGKAVG